MFHFSKPVLLWTDIVLWLLFAALLFTIWRARGDARMRAGWAKVFRDPYAAGSAIVVAAFLLLTMVDSIHFRRALPNTPGATATAYDVRTESLLDVPLAPLIAAREVTYSTPLAWRGSAGKGGCTARCSSKRSARTTCARRAPRACPSNGCCSATCCAMR